MCEFSQQLYCFCIIWGRSGLRITSYLKESQALWQGQLPLQACDKPGVRYSLKSNSGLDMCTAKSIVPPGMRTSKVEEYRVAGTGSKNSPHSKWGHFYFHPFGFRSRAVSGAPTSSSPSHLLKKSGAGGLCQLPSIPFQWHIQGPRKGALSGLGGSVTQGIYCELDLGRNTIL